MTLVFDTASLFCSEVSLTYYQAGIHQEALRSYVKPHHAVPYALDEPTLAPVVTLSAPGGSTENYNMDVIGSGVTLTYENFIYIALTSTFTRVQSEGGWGPGAGAGQAAEDGGLVLEVEGTRVVLARKEAGKRSQVLACNIPPPELSSINCNQIRLI